MLESLPLTVRPYPRLVSEPSPASKVACISLVTAGRSVVPDSWREIGCLVILALRGREAPGVARPVNRCDGEVGPSLFVNPFNNLDVDEDC